MSVIKKIDVPKIDFTKIASTASKAKNGSFLDISSINTSYWGDSSNNTVDIESVDGYDNVYLVSENGVALGFTTGDFLDDETSTSDESIEIVNDDVSLKSVDFMDIDYSQYQSKIQTGDTNEIKSFYASGNISSIKHINDDGSYYIEFYGDNDSGLWNRKVFYDANGVFEKLYKYSINGDYNVINVYNTISGNGNPVSAIKYDQNWQKVSDIEYLENGNYFETVPYKDGTFKALYDKNGNILSGDYIVDDKIRCSYGYQDGKIILKQDYYDDNSMGKYRYDSSGNVISFVLSDGNGNNVISLRGEGKWESYNGYEYHIDENGTLSINPISEYRKSPDGVHYYRVDSQGMVTITTLSGEGAGEVVEYLSVSDARGKGYMPSTLDSVQHFNQYDYSNVKFWDGSTIANSGCGFCSVASVISYFTGDENYTPISACEDYGDQYMMRTGGMSHALIPKVADDYGLNCTQTNSINDVVDALKNGAIVVTSQDSRGIFTSSGHIMTLSGIDSNGNIIVDDSLRDSTQSFSPATVDQGATKYWILSN